MTSDMISSTNIFPIISSYDEVAKAIDGRPEFAIKETEHYKIVFYNIQTPETFLDPFEEGISSVERYNRQLLRECRGITFDMEGRVIVRAFHKFFNAGEKPEVDFNKIDLKQPHIVMDKLDGSMVSPLPILIDNRRVLMRWKTKRGISNVAMQAEMHVAKNRQYVDFAYFCYSNNITPIFEWCSPKMKIVIDYGNESLTLLAIRNNITGQYYSHQQLLKYGVEYNLPVVNRVILNESFSMQSIYDTVRQASNIEGYVLRFDSGTMVKIKTDWYRTIHHVKDDISSEKNVVAAIVHQRMDDIKPFLDLKDRANVELFEKIFWEGVRLRADKTQKIFIESKKAVDGDVKRFAIELSPKMNEWDRMACFELFRRENFDPADIEGYIIDHMKRKLVAPTAAKIEQLRPLWGGHKWQYAFYGNE